MPPTGILMRKVFEMLLHTDRYVTVCYGALLPSINS
jgi:hypothetical protein